VARGGCLPSGPQGGRCFVITLHCTHTQVSLPGASPVALPVYAYACWWLGSGWADAAGAQPARRVHERPTWTAGNGVDTEGMRNPVRMTDDTVVRRVPRSPPAYFRCVLNLMRGSHAHLCTCEAKGRALPARTEHRSVKRLAGPSDPATAPGQGLHGALRSACEAGGSVPRQECETRGHDPRLHSQLPTCSCDPAV
jgi:hypothetical protein